VTREGFEGRFGRFDGGDGNRDVMDWKPGHVDRIRRLMR
jgi:hypothetical protein